MKLNNLDSLREYRELKPLLAHMPHQTKQLNKLFTADVEIVNLGLKKFMAITSDSIADEISFNLYNDPYTWGWMSVMVSISDMAAAAVIPTGVMITNIWSEKSSQKEKLLCQKGISDALRASHCFLLGGDSGVSHDTSVMSTAVGFCENNPPLTRLGIKHGDHIAILGEGTLGTGPALAYGIIYNHKNRFPESAYRPNPSPQLMKKIKPFCHASIDTSDGLAASLHILSCLNDCRFEIQLHKNLLNHTALKYVQKNKISPLMLLLGDHGDYQCLISYPEKNRKKIETICGSNLIPLGQAFKLKNKSVPLALLSHNGAKVHLPIESVQNCPRELKGIIRYSKEMNKTLYKTLPQL